MRALKCGALLFALALPFFVLVACDSTPKLPEEVAKATTLLDEGWQEGAAVQARILECAVYTPGLPYVRAKLDKIAISQVAAQRQAAVTLLNEWADPGDIEVVRGLLGDDKELVALLAARGLASRGDGAGVEILLGKMRTPDGLLDPEICGLLAKVGNDACLSEAVAEVKSKDEAKSAAAASALIEIGGEQAADAARAALTKLRAGKRVPAIIATGVLGTPEKDTKRIIGYLRYKENVLATLGALGDLGGEKAEAKLREVMAKKDRRASLAAAGALAKMGVVDADVLAKFDASLSDESMAIRYEAASFLSEAESSPEVLALLTKALGDEEAKVVRAALEGLRGHAGPEQMPALQGVWDRYNESMEGASYDAALQTVVVISKIRGPEADAFLLAAVDHKNWAHAIQASLGILERSNAPASEPS